MDKPMTGNDTSGTSEQEPGDGRRADGDAVESLDKPLADEHVNTQEQRNQAWTTGPGRQEDEPMRMQDSSPAPTLDRPQELEDKLDEVMANPHSDAQDTTDTQGEPRELGGMPKTGSGEQDPMTQTGGGQAGG